MITALSVILGAAMLSQANYDELIEGQIADLEASLGELKSGTAFGASKPSPYERFLAMEPSLVPDYLLVAVLIAGATNRNPVHVAQDMLAMAEGLVDRIDNPEIYKEISGIGDAARARILASAELNRRVDYARTAKQYRPKITTLEQAKKIARTLATGDEESLGAIFIDNSMHVVGTRILSKGTDRFTITDPRQILRHALGAKAAAIILVHNHPSGSAEPSPQDIEITERVYRAASTMGIRLLDHIIIAGSRETSMTALGQVPGADPSSLQPSLVFDQ